MKQNYLKICTIVLLGFGLTGIQAQESANVTGGTASGTGGSVSYTVGQIAYSTSNGTKGSITEGVQQPYEISVVSGIKKAKGINLSVSVYPNPTANFLTLSVDDYDISGLSFKLYDMNGKLWQNKKLTNSLTQINMNGLTTANYLLKVFKDKKEIKAFIIIKK